jgi:hypothetical protein
MRLGIALVTGGDPDGAEILAAMVKHSDRWLTYARALCLRYQIEADGILNSLS